MKILKKTLKMILYFLLGFIVLTILVLNFDKSFGAKTKGSDLETIKQSPHYKDGKFQNFSQISLTPNGVEENFFQAIKTYLFENRETRRPKDKIPSKQINRNLFEQSYPNDALLNWLGHSTVLIRTEETTIITDPILSERASFSSLVGPKKFPFTEEHTLQDLPQIDVVLISHDHYDHLDHQTILYLKDKAQKFYVPLGVKAHLQRWEVPEEKIEVFDWYEQTEFQGITFVFTPTQHFSGRSLTDSRRTLWGSWVIKSPAKNIYVSGDTGYFKELEKIGQKYGPFDITFLENGAYNQRWASIHMFPEQTVQAALDLETKILFPIHNSKFNLALHSWFEPMTAALKASEATNLTVASPVPGQAFTLNGEIPQIRWWKEVE